MKKRAAFALLMVITTGIFLWLGIWQLERRAWKLELIAQTEHKLTAEPVSPPAPADWATVSTSDAYTRVRVSGQYLPVSDTFVVASTRLGRGFWVMTPLETTTGFVVWINRGFVTSGQKTALKRPIGAITITGLLRLNEPRGSLLQANDARNGRWYSRDVVGMSKHLGLRDVAPYFIDATNSGEDIPVSDLTIVTFPNNHLQYALTWFGMALLAGVGLGVIFTKRF